MAAARALKTVVYLSLRASRAVEPTVLGLHIRRVEIQIIKAMLRSIVDELVVYRRPSTGIQTADRANAEIIGSLRHTRTADGKRGGSDIIPRKSYIA